MIPQTVTVVDLSAKAARSGHRMEGFLMSRHCRPRHSRFAQDAAAIRSCRGHVQTRIGTKRFALTKRMALALFVLAATSLATFGQEFKIVVPNALENVEGNIDGPTGPIPFRWQQLSPASEFATLPDTHRTIIGFLERPDRTVTTPRTVVINDLLIRLSTTSKSVLDTVFDENLGDDLTTVFDGPVTVSTQATGPPAGPRGFDYFFEFDTPFVYDPNRGNLLWDVVSFSGQSPPTTNPDYDSSVAAIWNSNPNARTGTRVAGDVASTGLRARTYKRRLRRRRPTDGHGHRHVDG